MLVRVLAEIDPKVYAATQSFSVMDREGETSYVSADTIDLVRRYTTSEGMDYCWCYGVYFFEEIMLKTGQCKKPDNHKQAWSIETRENDDNCDCDFFADGPVFVVTTNKGIHYVVHPEDSHLFDRHVSSKRLKSE
jgi:hypothetical protein